MTGKTFKFEVTVEEKHIDRLNHVNNEVYMSWALQASGMHSEFLGYGMEKFLATEGVFVVRRHELDYLAPAFLGQQLQIETWLFSIDRVRSEREYKITRLSDNKIIFQGKTLWVYVNLKTGRPQEIPADMLKAYSEYLKIA